MSRILVPRRRPEALLLEGRPGDLLLLPGELPPPVPTAARLASRYDLLPVRDRSRLAAAVPGWLAEVAAGPAARDLARDGIPVVELIVGELVPALLEALRTALLLARLGGERPAAEWLVGAPWPVLDAALAGTRIPRERVRSWREPRLGTLLAALGRLPGPVVRTRARAAAPRPGPLPATGHPLLLVNPRTAPLAESLEEAGIPLARLVPSGENRYLPAAPEPAAIPRDGWDRLLATLPEPEGMPGAPGFEPRPVLARLLDDAFPRAARRLAEARAWRSLLRHRRIPGIVGGLPWQGDLRALAFAARAEGIPYVAVQDGVLGWTGIGGLLPRTAVLSWGPEGTRWFLARGFPPEGILEVGDPLLGERVARVHGIGRAEARQRLGLPPDRPVLAANLANSAPHDVHAEEDSPLAPLRPIARGARAAGWIVVFKPHPRLPRVDGLVRLAEACLLLRDAPARVLSPGADPAIVLAAADAWISEGDTMTLEAVASGRAAILWEGGRAPCPYPDLAASTLPRAADADALVRVLSAGPPPVAREVLPGQVRAALAPAEAIARLITGVGSAH